MKNYNKNICIAPMLDWTDRHYRYMMRPYQQRNHALYRDDHTQFYHTWRQGSFQTRL